MAKTDERMQMIGSAITLQAEAERRKIIDEANAFRERELAAYKDEVIQKLFAQMQQQTRDERQKTVRQKARAAQQARRELLRRREELAAQVFEDVRARLRAHAGTPQYREDLLAGLRAQQEKFDHSTSTVQLREADLALAPEIQRLLPGCRVEAAKRIRLGGFRLLREAAGILVDATLDSALAEQRPWFLENCGMKVDGGDGQ